MIRKAYLWLKKACRTNRVVRTFVQGIVGHLAVQTPVVLNGGGDVRVALEALAVGAVAAGISAIWKTAAAELDDPT